MFRYSDLLPLRMLRRRRSPVLVFTHVSSKEMLYAKIYEPDARTATYQAYTEAITIFEKILLLHAVVIEEAAKKEQIVSVVKETLIEQEPEVILHEVPVKKIRTQTETVKPVQQFSDNIDPPKPQNQIVFYNDSFADSGVYDKQTDDGLRRNR